MNEIVFTKLLTFTSRRMRTHSRTRTHTCTRTHDTHTHTQAHGGFNQGHQDGQCWQYWQLSFELALAWLAWPPSGAIMMV